MEKKYPSSSFKMTDGARQRSSTSVSAKDAASEKESGGGVALKKEIGLVSACGIIVGKTSLSRDLDLPYGGTNHCNRELNFLSM